MPYLIALILIIITAGAVTLFRQPEDAQEVVIDSEPARTETVSSETDIEIANPIEEIIDNDVTPTEPVIDPVVEPIIETQEEVEEVQESASLREVYAEAAYLVPRRIEHDIQVGLTLDGEIIVAADITHDGGAAATKNHLAFAGAYEEFVIGANINTISLSRVGGASMTSDAFNDAVAIIREEL